MAEALMKQLTGESTIKAKFMRENYFEFENQAAVWLATNHKPIVQAPTTRSAQVRLIPFEATIPEARRWRPTRSRPRYGASAMGS